MDNAKRYCVSYCSPNDVVPDGDGFFDHDQAESVRRTRRFVDEALARKFAAEVPDYFDSPELYVAEYITADEFGPLPDGPRWECLESLEYDRKESP